MLFSALSLFLSGGLFSALGSYLKEPACVRVYIRLSHFFSFTARQKEENVLRRRDSVRQKASLSRLRTIEELILLVLTIGEVIQW